MVDRDPPGISVTRSWRIRERGEYQFRQRLVSADAVIGAVDGGADILDPALDIARIGLAAEMLGGTLECFERTVAYLKERKQFGVAIGSFQALKHGQQICFMKSSCQSPVFWKL